MTHVRDVMTEHVTTVPPDAPLADVARMMRDEDIGSVPVAEGERLIGMVTDRDIVIRCVADGRAEGARARDVMSGQVHYCREDQAVDDVLKDMGELQVRRLPVVDENMHLVGIVSLGDLSRTARPAETGESLKDISQPGIPH
ncbi:MAG: CBS domain-containing protein [Lysobacterales bacterium]|nr:MAG: CBS domain-containing protein [Xanthomonadales bacterium]